MTGQPPEVTPAGGEPAGVRLELRIYDRSISVDEHRQLRRAASRAAAGTDTDAITWLNVPEGNAAIVPTDLVKYALRHGWGR